MSFFHQQITKLWLAQILNISFFFILLITTLFILELLNYYTSYAHQTRIGAGHSSFIDKLKLVFSLKFHKPFIHIFICRHQTKKSNAFLNRAYHSNYSISFTVLKLL